MNHSVRPGFQLALQRLDLLLHREIMRLRASYQLSTDEFRGLYISDSQVDEMIRNNMSNNTDLPPEQAHADGGDSFDQLSIRAEALRGDALKQLHTDQQWRLLAEVFQLSAFEQDVMLLALAPELHSKYEVLYAYLNNDVTRKHPSIDLALRLFTDGNHEQCRLILSHHGKLFGEGLLQFQATAGNPYWLQQGFHLCSTILSYIFNRIALDPEHKHMLNLRVPEYVDWQHALFSPAVSSHLQNLADALQASIDTPFIVMEGSTFSGRDFAAENCLAYSGLGSLAVDLTTLLDSRDQLQERLQSIRLSALVGRAGVIVSGLDELLQSEQPERSLIKRFFTYLCNLPLPVFILCQEQTPWQSLLQGYKFLAYKIPPTDSREREALWRIYLRDIHLPEGDRDVGAVADFFHLDFNQIRAAAENLRFCVQPQQNGVAAISRDDLFQVAKQQSYGAIGKLAQPVKQQFNLDDLILPGATLSRINEVINAIKNRSTVYQEWGMARRVGSAAGIAVLFAGASGTGKTMTAGVIANAIGLDVYRIDLSGIVSKYIGETEKNLDRIFTAAKQSNCILFFDEADALFGKRSEVKDAHDRYANVEVAYLLQKMEEHDGIVILTTNIARNIDQAFTRRLQFIIEFPRPDEQHREMIWKSMFTENTPVSDDVDFNFLARQFNNTGGDIKNIAIDAAMLAAASEHKTIDMPLLIRASARHMVKQGKVPSASDFKHYFELVDVVKC